MRRRLGRLGLTEGQGYSIAILVVVAILLTSSLTRLHGRVAELISAPDPAATTTTLGVAGPGLPPPTGRPAPSTGAGRPGASPAALPSADPGRGPTAPGPSTPTTPTTVGGGDGRPPDAPCPADAAVQGFRGIVEQVDTLVGGIVPSAALVSTLAIVTGCSQTDPVVLLLATLVEVGQGLPDLGLGFLELPVLPFLAVPDPLVDLVQPLRPVLDPVCGVVGTLGLLFSQVGPSYPFPLDAAFAVSLFYATATCGQIQGF